MPSPTAEFAADREVTGGGALQLTCAHDRRGLPAAEGLQAPVALLRQEITVAEKKWGIFSRRGADPADFGASNRHKCHTRVFL